MSIDQSSQQLPAASPYPSDTDFHLTVSYQSGNQPPVTYRFDFPTLPSTAEQTVEVTYQKGQKTIKIHTVPPEAKLSKRISKSRNTIADSPSADASSVKFQGRVAGPRYSHQNGHKPTTDPNSPLHRSFSILEDIFVLAYKNLNMNDLRKLHANLFKFNRSEPTFVLRIKRLKAFTRNEQLNEAMVECVRTSRENYEILNKVTIRKDKNIAASYTLYRIEKRQLGAIAGPNNGCSELLDKITELLRTGLQGDGSLARQKGVVVHNLELLTETDSVDWSDGGRRSEDDGRRSENLLPAEDLPEQRQPDLTCAEPTVVAEFFSSKKSPNWDKKVTVIIK